MNILAINTAQKIGEICLWKNNICDSIFLNETKSFSENILVKIDEILKKNNLSINTIDIISVVCGPGSFTGTRIGISLVKGIVCANKNIKVISLNVFDILKQGINEKDCIIIEDSAVGDYYFAEIKNNKIEKIGADNLENIKKLNVNIFDAKDILNENLLIKATLEKYERSEYSCLDFLEPIYVKASQAQRELKKKICNEIKIENMKQNEIDFVMNIENEYFKKEKYSKRIFESEIKGNLYFVAKFKDEIVGFVGFSVVENEAEILKIAIKNNYLQMGIGTLLINYFINKMKDINKIYLEVNENNVVAKKFYESLNFKVTGNRKNYYGKNENAILMEWNSENK